MKRQDFSYELPKELIAQEPTEKRDECRLLVYDKSRDEICHKQFFDIVDYFSAGDVLVLNNTRVLPARLFGKKADTGAKIEVFLLRQISTDTWQVLLKPQKRVKVGTEIIFSDGKTSARVEKINGEDGAECKFFYEGIFNEVLEQLGEMPLPHYITKKPKDNSDYQTVFNKVEGSVAAPTAGLHFTHDLLARIKAKGVTVCEVLLHVGLGTFRPVKVDNITQHKMHSEYFEISSDTIKTIEEAKQAGKKVFCCGTTAVRVVESFAKTGATSGFTDIFIYPPYEFSFVDGLITNFHLPESTLLMLVAAFVGLEETKKIYEEAVCERYRFFSFGDAMLII